MCILRFVMNIQYVGCVSHSGCRPLKHIRCKYTKILCVSISNYYFHYSISYLIGFSYYYYYHCVLTQRFNRLQKDSQRSSDTLSLALHSSISGSIFLGLYLCCSGSQCCAHKFDRVHTKFCSISLEAISFCLHSSTVRDLSLTSASCLRESVLQSMNFILSTELVPIQFFYST